MAGCCSHTCVSAGWAPAKAAHRAAAVPLDGGRHAAAAGVHRLAGGTWRCDESNPCRYGSQLSRCVAQVNVACRTRYLPDAFVRLSPLESLLCHSTFCVDMTSETSQHATTAADETSELRARSSPCGRLHRCLLRQLHPQLWTLAAGERMPSTDELLRRRVYARARAACLGQPSAAPTEGEANPALKRAAVRACSCHATSLGLWQTDPQSLDEHGPMMQCASAGVAG